ncbi:MAG: DUF4974 domain-containing protein [Candidatus Pseudobacter hemicellulosilyticus]|uniref:DUF4974 domain-containing protein n=1 Tax=Candidatus Pseudobacter hemicellulosilyticus TaxID=3121375 RepID=A0AAJ6BF64_9BACT|nr:MAG: DUF4974 domain-containing protein [Pseudobacter sp.]
MTRDEFLIVYQRYLNGACTPEELEQLYAYQDEMELEDAGWNEAPELEAITREAIKARLNGHIQRPRPLHRQMPVWLSWAAAAVLAGLVFGSLYLAVHRNQEAPATAARPTAAGQRPLAPDTAGRKTYLTLGNGQVISLTDAANGAISSLSGIVTSKQEDGLVTYQAVAGTGPQAVPDTNSIQTPYGDKFSITLADGSKVWLNATSGLRFPVFFTGNKREVYLTGEACFEVKAHPERPFIVHVNGVAVEALGTLFNIKSHSNERNTVATLLSGAVQVTLPAKKELLQPGLQALYDAETGRLRVQKANTRTVLAWREGIFAFEHDPVSEIMYEIGRWYNREIVFVHGNSNKRFTYTFQRNESLEEALKRLELTGSVQLQTHNNKIMVTIP